ncbi:MULTISPECIES: Cof-type HAD-IIB family hydrolase [Erysipelotrichaceae]|uniref:Cof-type HAD-IIB family hydrolase n=1 Tax=Erysipelotrichaceae TaxID=128827 RepID=UPI001314C180|nr:Cof-type HAD-IIB family hydrolase [Absiella sp. AM27-20]
MNLHNIKLIACDVDGTLFNSKGKIGVKTKKTLMNLQKQGIKIAICSGRAPFELKGVVDELELKRYEGYLLHGNGAGIYCVKNDKNIQFPQVQPKELSEMIKLAHALHLFVIISQYGNYYCSYSLPLAIKREIAKRLYHPMRASKIIRMRQFAYMARNANMVEHLENHVHEAANKICIRGKPKKLHKAEAVIRKKYPDKFNYFYLSEGSLEITDIHVSKAQALQALCDQMDIRLDQVIAFGDSNNDDEMLSVIPYGVAMQNAFSSTKKAASYITKSNDEEGIAVFLNNFFNQ